MEKIMIDYSDLMSEIVEKRENNCTAEESQFFEDF